MEIREWCHRILGGESVKDKLYAPDILTDHSPGPAVFWDTPSRLPHMKFSTRSKKEKLPSLMALKDKDNRAICLHRFAGHELLAVEIMAYALLAFPEAPKHFRRGVANTLKEEQGHVELYRKRLHEMGVEFGSMALYKHFWSHTPFLRSPLKYISVMSLTFEMANLDFAPMYKKAFASHGDELSSQLMHQILEDEIAHVSFGMHWLNKLKTPSQGSWECWRENSPATIALKRARGFKVFEENRKKAGIPQDWIDALKNT